MWSIDADMEALAVENIIGDNTRFKSPFDDPPGYYIVGSRENALTDEMKALYWSRLKYAVLYAERLIQEVLRVTDSAHEQLRFDSFVLNMDDGSITSCLTNDTSLRGHFIECQWDQNWTIVYAFIC